MVGVVSMDKKTSLLSLLGILVVFALACATASEPSAISVGELDPVSSNLMVKQTSDIPVYLVMDTEDVPAAKTVLVDGRDEGGRLVDVDQFVKRDLRRFYENYFDEVHVVEETEVDESAPHVVVHTQLHRVDVQPAGSDARAYYGAAVLTWGLAMGYSEADEYMFSMTGDSMGAPAADHDRIFRTMFESAISDLGSAYSEKELHQKILQLPDEEPESEEPGTKAQRAR